MIDVLLATYNGARHLPALLDSLFAQSCQEFRISVLDDASTDETGQVLDTYAARYPGRIRRLPQGEHTGEPSRNFFRLLSASSAPYAMFCDQDDVWKSDKIERSLEAMQREEQRGAAEPLLVHTDLEVVGEDLQPVSPSFMRYQRLDPAYQSLPRLVVQNNVTGCTMLINRVLRDLVQVPDAPCMHDWWIALAAAAFGKIVYVPATTVLYRQHGNNVVGAQKAGSLSRALSRLRDGAVHRSLERTYYVADTFLRTYKSRLTPAQQEFLSRYAACGSAGILGRMALLMRYRAFKKGTGRSVAQILFG